MPPSGLVTFLFTDIEGSTRLAQEFPDTLPAALERHHTILREAVESHNGFVFEIVGDAFCCAFENTDDALKAAVDAQISLGKEKWNDVIIKVRMGIDRGNVEWLGTRYGGYITLARTARVMSAAYGGQILISNTAFESSFEKDSDAVTFRDLGERRLKDVIQPVRLFQIVSNGLTEEFPPLKTLDARPNNLPVQLTSFIGREEEMKQIKTLLKKTHLLTLTGSGGTGKTRLAFETGADLIDDFANGVWVTELAGLSDPSFIELKIAAVFKLSEKKDKSIREIITDHLGSKELLLILDNCEHLVEECAAICEALLKSCANLKILSTGREPLHIHGETIYQLLPMTLPGLKENSGTDEILQYDTVRLFTERALSAKTDFTITDSNIKTIAELCRKLDGLPLAIELAAARVRTLPVENILENINDRFQFLTSKMRTSLPKQQALKAMIDWSYDLLSENEKSLFRNLSVFAGGATQDAVLKVCSDGGQSKFVTEEILSGLTDKSLIRTEETNSLTRYDMLETMRLYGIEKLSEEGELHKIQKKYFEYFTRMAAESADKLTGSDQKQWVRIIESEIDNIRECLKWSMENEPVSALRMSVSLGHYWSIGGSFIEGYNNLSESLSKSDTDDKMLRAKANLWMGFFKLHNGHYDSSGKFLEESVALFREINEKNEIANSLSYLGTVAIFKKDFELARKYQEECLEIYSGNDDKRGMAGCLNSLGFISYSTGDFEKAAKILEESLQIYKELNDARGIAANLGNLGKIETSMKKFDKAKEYLEESLVLSGELGDKYITAHSLEGLSVIYLNFQKYELSCRILSLAKSMFEEIEVELRGEELSTFTKTTEDLKLKLGEDEFEKQWNADRSDTLKELLETSHVKRQT